MFILSHVLLFTSHRFHPHLYSSSFSTDHFSGTLTSSLSTQIPMQFMSDCRKDMVAWRLVPRGWGGLGSKLGLAIVYNSSNGRHIPLTVLNFIFEKDIYLFIPTSPPLSPPSPPPNPLTLWKAAFGSFLKEMGKTLNCLHTNFKGWLGEGGWGRGGMLWCHWVLQTIKGGLLGCARWVI